MGEGWMPPMMLSMMKRISESWYDAVAVEWVVWPREGCLDKNREWTLVQ